MSEDHNDQQITTADLILTDQKSGKKCLVNAFLIASALPKENGTKIYLDIKAQEDICVRETVEDIHQRLQQFTGKPHSASLNHGNKQLLLTGRGNGGEPVIIDLFLIAAAIPCKENPEVTTVLLNTQYRNSMYYLLETPEEILQKKQEAIRKMG